MGKNKLNITQENFNEWISSLGFNFPRNDKELSRFERLYSDFNHELSGKDVDPDKIIKGEITIDNFGVKKKIDFTSQDNAEMKLAARNFSGLPEHIIKKLKKNQDGNKSNE